MELKKIVSLILSVLLLFLVTISVSAESNSSSYYEYLSKFTGKSVAELKNIENKNGDLSTYFNIQIPSDVLNETSDDIEGKVSDGIVSSSSVESDNITTKDSNYYNSLAEYTGMTVSELKELEQKKGDLNEYFNLVTVANTNNLTSTNEITTSTVSISDQITVSSGGGSDSKMTSKQWSKMKSKADKGDILISKDQSTFVINHGHCAIVYTQSSRTVEAPGGDSLSGDYDINRWSNVYTMRDYYPTGTSSFRKSAADYAYDNLQGKPYSATAKRTNKSKLNCATLVWQAYKSQGTTLDYAPSGSVTPMCFVLDTDLNLWAEVNWSGGNHTW